MDIFQNLAVDLDTEGKYTYFLLWNRLQGYQLTDCWQIKRLQYLDNISLKTINFDNGNP